MVDREPTVDIWSIKQSLGRGSDIILPESNMQYETEVSLSVSNFSYIFLRHLRPTEWGVDQAGLDEASFWQKDLTSRRLKSLVIYGRYPNLVNQQAIKRKPPFVIADRLARTLTEGLHDTKDRIPETALTDKIMSIDDALELFEDDNKRVFVLGGGTNRPRGMKTDDLVFHDLFVFTDGLTPQQSRELFISDDYFRDARFSPINTLNAMRDIGISDPEDQLVAWTQLDRNPQWQQDAHRLHIRTPRDLGRDLVHFMNGITTTFLPLYNLGARIIFLIQLHELHLIGCMENPSPVGFASALYVPVDRKENARFLLTDQYNEQASQREG